MTALTMPARPEEDDARLRPVPWRRMAGVTWRQHRIALIGAAYFLTKLPRSILFWAAFILTRPLGATLGDILTKPVHQGGLNLDRIESSLALAVFMAACISLTSLRRPAPLGTVSH